MFRGETSTEEQTPEMNRRTVVLRMVALTAAGLFTANGRQRVNAQEESTPVAESGLPEGIGYLPMLSGGMVPDMPAGPVTVNIYRLTAEPGAVFPAMEVPYPGLMYIESGISACPGGPDRVVYNPDGTVLEVSDGDGVQYIPTGTTQYIPAGKLDGAGNEGPGFMSSIVIEFVPA